MTIPGTPQLPYHLDPSPGSGAMPARAHLDSDRPEASLAGTWGFRYSPSVSGAHPDPAAEDADFPDTVTVPGHWVLDASNGPLVIGSVNRFGSPWYTNVDYPFPVDPPFVPDANGTGDHLRTFTADELGFTTEVLDGLDRIILRFEGVESTFKVWLNGTAIGHASGSRLTHEFDVTDTLRPGGEPNRLVVRVHAFSAASYLEDQDQWWLPGIFRDVTLIGEPVAGIRDVHVVADYDDGAGHLTLDVDAPAAAFPLRLSIPGLGATHEITTARTELDVGTVKGWTAETPHLYRATLSSPDERVTLRLGFRRVDIHDGVLRVNGSPIRLRGVNRHEFHPTAGRAVTADFTRSELQTMKRHHINAIRTSHYPPNHHLLDLADELGFWLVDECDLETHGFVAEQWERNPSDDPTWREAYLDRIERTWRRDANHASVVMFSLGNEAGTGANLAAMADWLRGHDPMRPIHYEGDHDGAYTDVYSRMYATPTESASILAGDPVPSASAAGSDRIATQPYVLCEYAHAMGNGPGGLQDYEALFDAHPRAAGGFVWEYKDHGILAATADGRAMHAYGGDFAEPIHTSNFVLDGLVFADGTPSPGLAEYAAVIAGVRITVGEAILIENRQDFADTSHIDFSWRVDATGPGTAVAPLAGGSLQLPALPARSSTTLELPDAARHHPGAVLTVSARLATDTWWAPSGHEVSAGQGIIDAVDAGSDPTSPASAPGAGRAAVPAPERRVPAMEQAARSRPPPSTPARWPASTLPGCCGTGRAWGWLAPSCWPTGPRRTTMRGPSNPPATCAPAVPAPWASPPRQPPASTGTPTPARHPARSSRSPRRGMPPACTGSNAAPCPPVATRTPCWQRTVMGPRRCPPVSPQTCSGASSTVACGCGPGWRRCGIRGSRWPNWGWASPCRRTRWPIRASSSSPAPDRGSPTPTRSPA